MVTIEGAYQNSIEWLMSQVRLTSTHTDYLRTGHCAAACTFSGEPHLVRELMDRFAELSEAGQSQRAHAKEEV